MTLGIKINLVLMTVATVVLTAGFWAIVSIEGTSIEKQVKNDSETVAYMFSNDIEHMFRQAYNQQESLQSAVDKLSALEGVTYINIANATGVYISATDKSLIGKKAPEETLVHFDKVRAGGVIFDTEKVTGSKYTIERYIPIYIGKKEGASNLSNIIEVKVVAASKSRANVLELQKLLQVISVTIEHNTQSIITARNGNLLAIQRITDDVTKFGFYHDFIIFDDKQNVIANTGNEPTIFDNDPQVYKQIREDVIKGKIPEGSVQRIHNGLEVIQHVYPIQYTIGGKLERVGLLEIHVLVSAYKDKTTSLKLRMIGMGVILTAMLVVVLSIILRREVVEPIVRYSKIAQKVADGDLDQRIENTSSDEIGQFGEVFNSMVENLREFDKLKSDFISVAAHQLRTPLSGVKWVLKLLLDGDLGEIVETQRGMIKRGYDTNEKMIQLVNDLLNVSRIENGKFGYKFERNDFVKLLNTLMENIVLPSKERNINVQLDNKLVDIQPFMFDPEKLLIALQNIVDNAMKYTLPGGRVTIEAGRQGDYVQVKVTDTGVGIPKADIAKLFSKFFRAANVIHLQTDGSGLGLFIVKNIIIRHGGQIWVDSVEGKGTTFTVVIPVIADLLPNGVDGESPNGSPDTVGSQTLSS